MKRLQLIALAMIAGSISCTLRASDTSRSLSTLHLKIINTGTNPTGVLTVDFHDPTCYRDPLNALYSPCTDGKQAFFIDSDTSFTLKREMPWRQDIRIGVGARMDTHHAVLLSAPGDSASLTLDFGKICGNDDTGFVFGGKQGSLNAQINACEKYLSQLSETIRFPRDSSAYGLYPEKTAQMQDSLARYSARAKLSKAAKEWARQTIPARVYIQLRETLGFYQIDFPFLSQIASNDLQSLTFSDGLRATRFRPLFGPSRKQGAHPVGADRALRRHATRFSAPGLYDFPTGSPNAAGTRRPGHTRYGTRFLFRIALFFRPDGTGSTGGTGANGHPVPGNAPERDLLFR